MYTGADNAICYSSSHSWQLIGFDHSIRLLYRRIVQLLLKTKFSGRRPVQGGALAGGERSVAAAEGSRGSADSPCPL